MSSQSPKERDQISEDDRDAIVILVIFGSIDNFPSPVLIETDNSAPDGEEGQCPTLMIQVCQTPI